jgi:arylsulfatase
MSEAKISKTLQGSTPWWPPELRAPEGSPKILVVRFDDTGFSDFGGFGS